MLTTSAHHPSFTSILLLLLLVSSDLAPEVDLLRLRSGLDDASCFSPSNLQPLWSLLDTANSQVYRHKHPACHRDAAYAAAVRAAVDAAGLGGGASAASGGGGGGGSRAAGGGSSSHSAASTRFKPAACSVCTLSEPEAASLWKELDQGYGLIVDSFSLGVVLYTMLTGEQPFYEEEGRPSLMVQKVARWYNGGHPRLMACSPEARDIVHRLLSPSPAARMSAADAVNHPWLMRRSSLSARVGVAMAVGAASASPRVVGEVAGAGSAVATRSASARSGVGAPVSVQSESVAGSGPSLLGASSGGNFDGGDDGDGIDSGGGGDDNGDVGISDEGESGGSPEHSAGAAGRGEVAAAAAAAASTFSTSGSAPQGSGNRKRLRSEG